MQKLGRRPTPYYTLANDLRIERAVRQPPVDGKGEMIDGRGLQGGGGLAPPWKQAGEAPPFYREPCSPARYGPKGR